MRLTSNPLLVCFLYALGRDHLPLGKIESIMEQYVEKVRGRQAVRYSNGQLASWATELAGRLDDGRGN